MKNVLITGITGKNGRYFLEKLEENKPLVEGWKFRALLREGSDTTYLDKCSINMEKFVGSIETYDEAKKFAQGGFDTLLHIAGIQRSVPLVKAAIECGVKRFILVHTTGIYSKYKDAGEGYRQIDAEVTKMCEDAGVSLTILRPTMIYGSLSDGNMSVFINMVNKLRLFPVINGAKYELQPVWCKDLGIAFYDVLMNEEATGGKNYVLSGKEPILLIDIFKEIARQLGVKNTFVSCPYIIAYLGAWGVFVLTLGKKDFREKVQRMVEPRAYSHDDATRDFSYNPVSFSEGIKEEIRMYIDAHK